MVESCTLFAGFKPVYDGKKNLYTKEALPFGQERIELEVVMPGDSSIERKFRVALKVFFTLFIFHLPFYSSFILVKRTKWSNFNF